MKKIYSLIAGLALVGSVTAQTVTFNFTGAPQYYVVPALVTQIHVDVRGAQGGTASNLTQAPQIANGGLGGRVQCYLAVTPGDTLWIYVGGEGVGNAGVLTCYLDTGGWNGGGDGYSGYNSYNYNSGGGGGASDIRLNSQTIAARIVVGGGGGGGGCSGCTGGGLDGGAGGDTLALPGVDTQPSCFPGCNNGKGGGQFFGGGFGQWACTCTTANATAGGLGVGGLGDGSGCAVTCGSGGGGGGGYYGGGGGSAGPGGGGSSYTILAATSVIHTQGYQIEDGQVIIQNTTSVEETSAPILFRLSPNPTDSKVTLSFLSIADKDGELKLYDIAGKLLKTWNWNGEKNMSLDMSVFATGTYSLVLTTSTITSTQRIIRK